MLNPAEGLISLGTNFKFVLLCILKFLMFSPTTVDGTYGLNF